VSVHIESWAYKQKAGGASAKLVLIKLANMANDDGECWPGNAHLATELEMDGRTIRRKLAELIDKGLVAVEPQYRDNGSQTANRYFVGPKAARQAEKAGGAGEMPGGAGDTPGGGGQGATPGTVIEPPEKGTSATPRSDEQALSARKRNVPFDALVDACPGTSAEQDGSRVGKALAEIRRRVEEEATGKVPEMLWDARADAVEAHAFDVDNDPLDNHHLAAAIVRRAQLYTDRWPDAELTPTALAKHWTRVAVPKSGGKVTAAQMFAGIDPKEL